MNSTAIEAADTSTDVSEPSTNEQWENIFAASVMGVLSVVGFVFYFLIVLVIVRNRKQFLKHSYYSFVISLAVSDCLMLLLFALYSVPCTILQNYIFGFSFDRAAGVICALQYYGGCVTVALIALNRYWAVCRFQSYKSVFCNRNVNIFITVAWLFGIINGSFHIFSPFGQDYYYDGYGWGYDTSEIRWGNVYFTKYDEAFSVVMFVFLVWCYGSILLKGKGQDMGHLSTAEQKKRAKQERGLAFQFLIVVVILIVQGIGFTFVPMFTSNKWAFLALSVLFIINNSSSPYIFLIFNKEIRACFLKMVCFWKTTSGINQTTMFSVSVNSVRRATVKSLDHSPR